MSIVHVMDHPLIQHKLSLMRDQETGPKDACLSKQGHAYFGIGL